MAPGLEHTLPVDLERGHTPRRGNRQIARITQGFIEGVDRHLKGHLQLVQQPKGAHGTGLFDVVQGNHGAVSYASGSSRTSATPAST